MARLQKRDEHETLPTRLRLIMNKLRRFSNLRDGTIVGKWRHGLPKHPTPDTGR